jgi:glutathione S-transferase
VQNDLIMLFLALAAIEVWVFGLITGRARVRYGVEAPATSGHPDWERLNRVHQNSVEQLVVFMPLLLVYAAVVGRETATWLAAAFVVARLVYAVGYARSAKGREAGAVLTFLVQGWLGVGAIVGLVVRLVR